MCSLRTPENGPGRPSPGSIGKLRISNEMKHKLEMVTANHSLRSSSSSRPPPLPMPNMTPPAKLDSDRRLLLQHQLGYYFNMVKLN